MPPESTDHPSLELTATPEAPRRPYVVPTVSELGRLSTLFKGPSGMAMDGNSGRGRG
jgi:hypothetical protein